MNKAKTITRVEALRSHLHPGQVYRRQDLVQWSNVDRHLQELVEDGTLKKVAAGMYYYPTQSVFGTVPAKDEELVRSYLKDDRFLLLSFNEYNKLGVGTTQLYNITLVYNRKRHGEKKLGNRLYLFVVKPDFPKQVTEEYLLIDLVDNLHKLAEDTAAVLERVRRKVADMDLQQLTDVAGEYGGVKAKNFFTRILTTTKSNDNHLSS